VGRRGRRQHQQHDDDDRPGLPVGPGQERRHRLARLRGHPLAGRHHRAVQPNRPRQHQSREPEPDALPALPHLGHHGTALGGNVVNLPFGVCRTRRTRACPRAASRSASCRTTSTSTWPFRLWPPRARRARWRGPKSSRWRTTRRRIARRGNPVCYGQLGRHADPVQGSRAQARGDANRAQGEGR